MITTKLVKPTLSSKDHISILKNKKNTKKRLEDTLILQNHTL